jgi:hypothetical protein
MALLVNLITKVTLLLLLLFVITFMQGIYNYISETNHASRVYCLAAILWLQYMVRVMLLSMLNVLCFNINTYYYYYYYYYY